MTGRVIVITSGKGGVGKTTTGGRALKFYASVRMDIRKTEMMKQDGQVIGNRVRVKVIKNKVATKSWKPLNTLNTITSAIVATATPMALIALMILMA